MKLFRHTRLTITAVAVTAIATITGIGATGTGARAAITESGLSPRFSTDLYGDVTTTGNLMPACRDDCSQASAARLRVPEGTTIAHARLTWATGLGERCRAAEPATSPKLRIGESDPAKVVGETTGANTAEADVTKQLSNHSGDADITVAGVRSDACEAGWSLTVAYEAPRDEAGDLVKRHVAVYGGAVTDAKSSLRMEGFTRSGTAEARLAATVYGDARLNVNGTELATETSSHVTDTRLPAGVIAEGDTSADLGVSGGDPLVQQVALSVPIRDVSITATATPQRIGPGDTVVHTVTATNNADTPVENASFRVDLSRALDDATRPFDVTTSTGESAFAGKSLKWTGTIPANGTATLTYSVTIKNPRPGDGKLESTVIGGTDTNCSAGKPASECFVKLRFPPRPRTDVNGTGTGPSARLPVTGPPLGTLTAIATAALLGGAAMSLASRRLNRER